MVPPRPRPTTPGSRTPRQTAAAAQSDARPSVQRAVVRFDLPRLEADDAEQDRADTEQTELVSRVVRQRISSTLPAEVARQLRKRCRREGRTISSAVAEAVRDWLK